MGKKSLLLLFVFNFILIGAGWVMALYAYPHLPQKIPLWLNFLGQPVFLVKKSPLFFIYPLVQALFIFFFLALLKIKTSREMPAYKAYALKEFVYLTLIFFNMIFIHIQKSLIFIAHRIGEGVNKFYFFSLFCAIFLLIPYHHIRRKILKESGAN